MKKIIEQEIAFEIEIKFNDYEQCFELRQKDNMGKTDLIGIEKSKAREVALAICPGLESELKELEFKANGFRLQVEFFTKIRSELLPTEKDLTLPWYEMLYECIKNRRLKP